MRKTLSFMLAAVMMFSLIAPAAAAGVASDPGDPGGIVLPSSRGETDTRTPSQIGSGSYSSNKGGAGSASTGTGTTTTEEEEHVAKFTDFTDVPGHWAENYLNWSFENNLFVGVSKTKFNPEGNITRAQMATVITRSFGATKEADVSMFVDLKREDWCYSGIARAVQMGFLSSFGNSIRPGEEVNRQEVAVALVKAAGYDLVGAQYLNRFSDAATIDSHAREYMATAVAHKLMTGFPDGRIGPKDKITRAQFAVMMYKMASAYMNADTTFNGRHVTGSLVAGISNMSLDNMTIDGDLFISDGVDNGSVTLNKTTVSGTIYVRGGQNIIVTNDSSIQNVVMNNPNGAVNFRIDETSTMKGLTVRDGSGGLTITGDVGDLVVLTAKVPVKLTSATIDDLYIRSKAAAVTGDKSSTIRGIIIEEGSTGAAVDVAGTVETLECNASSTTVRVTGALSSLNFGSGVADVSLTLPTKGTMDEVNLDVDNLTLTFGGSIRRLHIGGDNCDIKLSTGAEVATVIYDGNKGKFGVGSNATVDNLTVNGDEVDVNIASGATVKKLTSDGSELEYDGAGTVNNFTITGGSDIKVEIPKTTVNNRGGKDVYTGDYYIRPGTTVTTDSNGKGDMETEIAEKNPITSKQFDINIKCGEGGTIQPVGKIQVYGTSDQTFTVKLENGYIVDHFLVDGREATLDKDNKYVLENIRENHTVDISFKDDPRYGGYHEQPNTRATWSLKFAGGAMPSDFGFNSKYSLNSFGSVLAFDAKTNKLSGTVNAIKNFEWYRGDREQYATEYYFPMVLESNFITEHATIKVGDAVFGKEVISTGSRYGGDWMVYVPLDSLATTKAVVVTFDPDGPDGTMFAASSMTLQYSDVRYFGGVGSDTLYRGIRPINGYDGAETAEISFGKTTLPTEPFPVSLKTANLLETRNASGRYGRWVGLYIPVLDGADNAKVRVQSPRGAYQDVVMKAQSVPGMSRKCIVWECDAGSVDSQASNKTWTLDIQWRSGNDNIELDGNKKVTVDLTEVVLAGGSGTSTAQPPLTDISLKQMSPGDLIGFGYTMDSFAIGATMTSKVNTQEYTVAGTFFPVSKALQDEYGGAYLMPMTMQAKVVLPCNIMVGTRVVGQINPPTATETNPNPGVIGTAHFFVPMQPYGTTMSDIRLVLQPQYPSMQFSNITLTVDASQTKVFEGGLVFNDTLPTGEINGRPVSSYIGGTDVSYTTVGSTITVRGTLYKQENATVGSVTGDLHLVPVNLYVRAAGDWTLKITGGGETYGTYSSDTSGTSLTVLVPVAKDGYRVLNSALTLYDGDGKVVSSAILTFSGELDEAVEDPPIVTPDPEKGAVIESLSIANMSSESFQKLGWEPSTFATGYGAQTTASGLQILGEYKEVNLTVDSKPVTGYQLPMTVTLTGVKTSGTISKLEAGRTTGIAGFTKEGAEGKPFDLLVPMTLGSDGKIVPFSIVIRADETGYTDVQADVDVSKATVKATPTLSPVATKMELRKPLSSDEKTSGFTMANFAADYYIDTTKVKLSGEFKEVTDEPFDGGTLSGIYCPLVVNLTGVKAAAKLYLVQTGKTPQVLKTVAVNSEGAGSIVVAVPLTAAEGKVNNFSIEIRPDAEGTYTPVAVAVTSIATVEGAKFAADSMALKALTADEATTLGLTVSDFVTGLNVTGSGDAFTVTGEFLIVEDGAEIGPDGDKTTLTEGCYFPFKVEAENVPVPGKLSAKVGTTTKELKTYTADDIASGPNLTFTGILPLVVTDGKISNFTLVMTPDDTKYNPLSVTVNMSGATVKDTRPVEKGDIATALTLREMTAAEATEQGYAVTDFADNYRVVSTTTGATITGAYKEVDMDINDSSAEGGKSHIKGYYVPVTMVIKGAKADGTIKLTIEGSTETVGAFKVAEGSGPIDLTVVSTIPLYANPTTNRFYDFTVTVAGDDTEYGVKTATGVMSGATKVVAEEKKNPDLVQSSAAAQNPTIYGCASTKMATGGYTVQFDNASTNYNLVGTFSPNALSAIEGDRPAGCPAAGWFAPVKVNRPEGIADTTGWKIEVWFGGGDSVEHFEWTGTGQYTSTLIPLGSYEPKSDDRDQPITGSAKKYEGVVLIVSSGNKEYARYVFSLGAGSTKFELTSMPADAPTLVLRESDITTSSN